MENCVHISLLKCFQMENGNGLFSFSSLNGVADTIIYVFF